MAKFQYTGKAGRHTHSGKDAQGAVASKKLNPGDVVDLTSEQAKAFADRFQPASAQAAPAPKST